MAGHNRVAPRGSVSVAMATCDGEAFLEDQLWSLVTQTRLPDELVVCDDASSDGTLRLLRSFGTAAPFPVQVLSNPRRLGHTATFLKAAAACTSDYVAFCDQDDIWLPQKLERCLEPLSAPDGPSLVAHAAEVVDAQLTPVGYRDPDVAADFRFAPGHGLTCNHYLGLALCFERTLLSLIPSSYLPQDAQGRHPPGHDHWACFLAGLRDGTMLLREPLVLYRQHSKNTVGGQARHTGDNLKKAASAGSLEFAERARSVEIWADVISRARANGHLSSRAVNAGTWERVHREGAAALRSRAALHDDQASASERCRQLAGLILADSYRPLWEGGLGGRAMVKDVLVCLLGRSVLQRLMSGIGRLLAPRG